VPPTTRVPNGDIPIPGFRFYVLRTEGFVSLRWYGGSAGVVLSLFYLPAVGRSARLLNASLPTTDTYRMPFRLPKRVCAFAICRSRAATVFSAGAAGADTFFFRERGRGCVCGLCCLLGSILRDSRTVRFGSSIAVDADTPALARCATPPPFSCLLYLHPPCPTILKRNTASPLRGIAKHIHGTVTLHHPFLLQRLHIRTFALDMRCCGFAGCCRTGAGAFAACRGHAAWRGLTLGTPYGTISAYWE